jgi:hypothetical protein
MDDVTRVDGPDGTNIISMDHITVDGIHSNRGDWMWVGNMITIKNDVHSVEIELADKNGGYLDDQYDIDADGVFWDAPHITEPYAHGEIDEEMYLKYGTVIGVNHPRYHEIKGDFKSVYGS